MAQFLRHIGRVGDRKVAVVFREIPGETHMALVVHTQLLNQNIHDPLMAVIESASGQNARDLADALNKNFTRDGKIILQVLHGEGMLKKIQTNQVVMTPAPNVTIRLDELNQMLDEMEKGEEAVRKLAEFDASRGLQDPRDVARRMRGESTTADAAVTQPVTPPSQALDPMSDAGIASRLREQATRMSGEARMLMAEAQRLMDEAGQLDGAPAVTAPSPAPSPKKAGRPRKAAAAA